MSNPTPPDSEPEDIDTRYLRWSRADRARPAESIAAAVLAHAGKLAAERGAIGPRTSGRSFAKRASVFAGLAAAASVGFVMVPRFFTQNAPAVKTAEQVPASAARNAIVQDSAPAPNAAATASLRKATPVDRGALLREAAASGNAVGVIALLDGTMDIDSRDSLGRSALMLAVIHGGESAVTSLLAKGADPNAADANGETPLQVALSGNYAGIAAALRKAGAR
jgi:Ankyrin repeats (many copies)